MERTRLVWNLLPSRLTWNRSHRGYTLTEVMILVSIITLLAAILLPGA